MSETRVQTVLLAVVCVLLLGNLGLLVTAKPASPSATTDDIHAAIQSAQGPLRDDVTSLRDSVGKDMKMRTDFVLDEVRASTKGLHEAIDSLR